MNARERFNATMDFQPVDRPMFIPYMGATKSARLRWKAEGLGERHWAEPFGFDVINAHTSQFAFVPVKQCAHPPFAVEDLGEHNGMKLFRDERGVTKCTKADCEDMTHFVSYPVTDRASWERYRTRLDPNTPGRLPENFTGLAAEYRDRDYVLGIGGSPMGLFSGIRELMGAEATLIACAEDPDWMREMAEHLADLWLVLYGRVLREVQPDFLFLWELVCTNKGPILAPRMFRELFLPSYQKLISGLKALGLKNVWIDCHANSWDMLPLLIESGATGTLPLEVRGGMDVVAVRRNYPRLQLIGGIERVALAHGREAIDRELARVAPVIPMGGYLPSVDHYFTADISWENLCYFFERLRRIVFGG